MYDIVRRGSKVCSDDHRGAADAMRTTTATLAIYHGDSASPPPRGRRRARRRPFCGRCRSRSFYGPRGGGEVCGGAVGLERAAPASRTALRRRADHRMIDSGIDHRTVVTAHGAARRNRTASPLEHRGHEGGGGRGGLRMINHGAEIVID